MQKCRKGTVHSYISTIIAAYIANYCGTYFQAYRSRVCEMNILPNFLPKNRRMFKLPAIVVPSTSRTGARPNGIPLKSKVHALNAPWKCKYHLAFFVFFSPLFILKPNVFVFHISLSEDYASCFCATPGIKIIQLVSRHGRYYERYN